VQPFLDAWKKAARNGIENYRAGSGGPEKADALLKRDGRAWRVPVSAAAASEAAKPAQKK
jgi:glucose-6-phosphate 1-dehydrogenase